MGRETPEGVRVRGLLLEAPRWLLGCEARDGACQPPTCPPRCDPRRHILTLLGWGGEKVLYLLEALPSCTRKIQGRRPTRPGWAERLRRILRGWECLCCSDPGGSLGGQSHSESSGSAGASSQELRVDEGTSGLPSSIRSWRSEALVYRRVSFHTQVYVSWCLCVCGGRRELPLPSDQGLPRQGSISSEDGGFLRAEVVLPQ